MFPCLCSCGQQPRVIVIHFGKQCCLRPFDHFGGHTLDSVALSDAAVRCVDDADLSRIPATLKARGIHGDAAMVIEIEGQHDALLPHADSDGAGVRRLDAPCLLNGDGPATQVGHPVPQIVTTVEAGHDAKVPIIAGIGDDAFFFGVVIHAHILQTRRAGTCPQAPRVSKQCDMSTDATK